MPKKKKKNRDSGGSTTPTTHKKTMPSQPPSPLSLQEPLDPVNVLQVQLLQEQRNSSSLSLPSLSSLKYNPTLVLHQADAIQLDVRSGEHIFLLMTTTLSSCLTTASDEEKDPCGRIGKEEVLSRAAKATVYIDTSSSKAVATSKISPSFRSGSKQRQQVVGKGFCQLFPKTLRSDFLNTIKDSSRPDTATHKAESPLSTPSKRNSEGGMTTPPPTASTPSSSSTPVTSSRPSSSKSKFSFANGGGGDNMVSSVTTSSTKQPNTPDSHSRYSTPLKTGVYKEKNNNSNTYKLWVVPVESTLGDQIQVLGLCRVCTSATTVSIADASPATTPLTTTDDNGDNNERKVVASPSLYSLVTEKTNGVGHAIIQRLVRAHLVGCSIALGVTFSMSFQGKLYPMIVVGETDVNSKVNNTTAASTAPSEPSQMITHQLSQLSLEDANDRNDESKHEVEQKILQVVQRNALSNQPVSLVEMTHDTNVRILGGADSNTTTSLREADDDESHLRPSANDGIAALDDVLEEVIRLISTALLQPEIESQRNGGFLKPLPLPKGLLLHGPSGTGKTLLMKTVVNQMSAKLHVEHIIGSVLQSKTALIGEAERGLTSVFRSAKRKRPGKRGSLIVVDDLHSVCPRRHGTNLGADRLSSTLLALLDGIETSNDGSRIFFVGITTNSSSLDAAIRRPGRLDSEIEVSPPDTVASRSKILQFLVNTMGCASTFSESEWDTLARLAKGFTGADIKLSVKEALRLSFQRSSSTNDVSITLQYGDMEKGIRSIKPSAIKSVAVEVPQVKWTAIGGMEMVKKHLREAIEMPLTHGELFQQLGIRPPRGVLLYGPPGCSKTLMARALATESHMNFLAVKGPELLSKWLGESERALAALFKRARLASPAVIFFDEVDAIAGKRRGKNEGSERLLSQLLTELDGITSDDKQNAKRSRVVVVCATNRPDLLDDALMRPGRIDRKIYVGIPDLESRRKILQIGLQGKACSSDVVLDALAEDTISGGLTGAELISSCHDAALLALEEYESSECKDDECMPEISMRHVVQALTSTDRQVTDSTLQFYSQFQGQITR